MPTLYFVQDNKQVIDDKIHMNQLSSFPPTPPAAVPSSLISLLRRTAADDAAPRTTAAAPAGAQSSFFHREGQRSPQPYHATNNTFDSFADRSQYYYGLASSLNKVYDATVSCSKRHHHDHHHDYRQHHRHQQHGGGGRRDFFLNNEDLFKAVPNHRNINDQSTETDQEPLQTTTPADHHHEKRSIHQTFLGHLKDLLVHKRNHGTLFNISKMSNENASLSRWCSEVKIAFRRKLRNEQESSTKSRYLPEHFLALFEIGFNFGLDCEKHFPKESVMKRKISMENGTYIEDDMRNLAEYDFFSISPIPTLNVTKVMSLVPDPVPSSSLDYVQGIVTHEFHKLSNIPPMPQQKLIQKTDESQQNSRIDPLVNDSTPSSTQKKKKSKCTTTVYTRFQQRINDLEAYKEEHGTLFNMSKRYKGYRSLGAWVAEVRFAYKKKINGLPYRSKLNDDQFRMLYEIGMDFRDNDTSGFGLESDLKRQRAIVEAKLKFAERTRIIQSSVAAPE